MISTNGKVTTHTVPTPEILNQSYGAAASAKQGTPGLRRTLWTAWKAYAQRAATYQGEILLSAVYFLVLGPCGLLARLFGKELLDLGHEPRTTYWITREPAATTLSGMQRQF